MGPAIFAAARTFISADAPLRPGLTYLFGKPQGHRPGDVAGQQERCSLAVVRADGFENAGGGGALIARGAEP